jgi:uncharacterized membrane protein YoaK (UPF0700 family)
MVLTATTGVVDAVSFVGLGHVFTANMTGNIVFIGFALGGARGLSIERSLTALAAFALGAVAGGRVANCTVDAPHRQLAIGAGLEAALLAIAATMAIGQSPSASGSFAYIAIVLTAVAMGIRNGIVRKLGVADVTTTVLTGAIAGLAGDSKIAGGQGARGGRKALSIVLMLFGALIGTLLLRHFGFMPPLAVAAFLAAAVAIAASKTQHEI